MHEDARYLLVGGGLASVHAAQAIRDHDQYGKIVIVGLEKHPPYDRPPLSKQFLTNDDFAGEDAYSKNDDFYPTAHVQLLTGLKATRIDRERHLVELENGNTVGYEKLLLATGSTPKALDAPGHDLPGIQYLRTIEDAEAIRLAMQHSRSVIIVGTGYIGMEVASGALRRGLHTTLVDQGEHPWGRFASPTLGAYVRSAYEAQGARIVNGVKVAEFIGEGRARGVRLSDGTELTADFIIVGGGVTLNTDLAREAGLEVDEKNGVRVDAFLRTADPSIWCAGDIAYFADVALNKEWHAEHFLNAKYQGRAVGAIMAGTEKPYDQVPYFFSDILDIHMILRGDPAAEKNTTVLGDLTSGEFVELYPGSDGVLRMGVAISHEESRLDPISEKLDGLIRSKARVAEISPDMVGLA